MADRKFLVDLDLNKNELQNVVIQNLATAPTDPKKGQHYFNTTDNIEYVWNGTAWVNALSQGNYTFTSGISESNRTVTLDKATTSALGGVVVGTNINVNSSTGTISVNDASTTQKGLIEIATDAEVTTGTSETLAINPKQLATKVTKNADITAGTGTKITYDAKGLITSSTTLSASDIPNLTLAKITDVTATAAEVNILDGVTATTAEINKLDGLTASTTELNYVTGVTSSIQNQIDALSGRGKFLAVWNPQTGLPSTNPGTLPYTYKTGDYYIVGTVGATSYRPTGTSYTGAASTTVETGTIAANDTYIFDGTSWTLQHTEQAATTWGSITGTLSAQTDLQNALNNKVTKNADITAGTGIKITYDAKGLVTGSAGLIASDIPDLSATYATASNTMTFSNKSINADNNTVSNLETDNFKSGVIQTTVRASGSASDTALASEKAIATAVEGRAKKITATNPTLTATAGVCTWNITNTIGSDDTVVIIKEVSTGAEVYCDVTYGSGTVTVKMNSTSNITAGTYKAIIMG